jgi:hypothetical protein
MSFNYNTKKKLTINGGSDRKRFNKNTFYLETMANTPILKFFKKSIRMIQFSHNSFLLEELRRSILLSFFSLEFF